MENLRDQKGINIHTNGHVPESYSGWKHGTSMIDAFHEIAPEAEIYISANWDPDLAWLQAGDITLVSQSQNSGGYGNGYSFLRPFGAGGFVDCANAGITCCLIAGNNAQGSYGFHLTKNSDPTNNYMIFPNGTDHLDFVVQKDDPSGFGMGICRSGFARPNSQYFFSINNTTTGIAVVFETLFKNNVVWHHYNIRTHPIQDTTLRKGEIWSLHIRRTRDTVDYLDVALNINAPLSLLNPVPDEEEYRKYSVGTDGLDKEVIETGAILPEDYNKRDKISPMSGRGPIPKDVDESGNVIRVPYTIKPDLCAPGEEGATSPTAPRVAGALAVLASAGKVDLRNPIEAKAILLREHVVQMGGGPNGIFGYGRLYLNTQFLPPDPVPPTPVPVDPDDRNVLIYPNPASLSANSYLKIANFSQDVSRLDAKIYNINGEFVKSFSILELQDDLTRKTLRWDLTNENGSKIAPGIYFISIKTDSGNTQIRKIAIQK
ncbi:MAG: S8 family peptidase [Endomicrobium sp.]|jgi:hypothetical protein|nr:S8 family peptidase [Endomicrobium sp.]